MRVARIKVTGERAVYHCISRVVGGQRLLGDEEKAKLREMLWMTAGFCGVEVITYCLMSNHMHLLVRVPEPEGVSDREVYRRARLIYRRKDPILKAMGEDLRRLGKLSKQLAEPLRRRMGDLSVFMKELKVRFSKWYNRRHRRFGTLWAERFKSVLLEDEPGTIRTVAAYIDLNPVRAGLVEDPVDYAFSGYSEAESGHREARRGISGFHAAGKWRKVSEAYRAYMLVSAGVSGASGKKALDREAIRRGLERGMRLKPGEVLRLRLRHMSEGMVLGTGEFVEEQFRRFRDRFGPGRKRGGKRLSKLQLGEDLSSPRQFRNPAA